MSGFYDVLAARGKCPPDCSLCEEACATTKDGGKGARIFHASLPQAGITRLVKCNQCSEPACAEICPTHAITRSDSDGVVRINVERCVGCGLCSLACPYGGIHYSPKSAEATKCDSCDGEPKCVEACKYDVLSFIRNRSVLNHMGRDEFAYGIPMCAGCSEELAFRIALRTLGKNIIVFSCPGCVVSCTMAGTQGVPFTAPAMGCTMTNTASCMTGVKRYYQNIAREVTCVSFCGDGATSDVGFQSLSGAAERNEKILYICADNEAYMNTGIQRSSTSPLFSWTTTTPIGIRSRGKPTAAKYVPLLLALHGISYTATASIAFLEDYVQKLVRAKAATKKGMAYVHILVPCTVGWRAPTNSAIELSRMAVETNYFPLWEAEDGKFRFTYYPKNPRPVREFTRLMGRFSHLSEEELKELQAVVDARLGLIDWLTKMPEKSALTSG